MAKKNIFLIIVLFLVAGSFFYWQINQADIRELNKILPRGVKVVKSLFGDEYRIINKIDGYEFRVPEEWGGVKEVEYISEREVEGYIGTSLTVRGNILLAVSIGIDCYISGGDLESGLKSWAESNFDIFGLIGNFTEDKVGEFNIIKTHEKIHLGGDYVYFFKKESIVYVITGNSEEYIRYIITNGEW